MPNTRRKLRASAPRPDHAERAFLCARGHTVDPYAEENCRKLRGGVAVCATCWREGNATIRRSQVHAQATNIYAMKKRRAPEARLRPKLSADEKALLAFSDVQPDAALPRRRRGRPGKKLGDLCKVGHPLTPDNIVKRKVGTLCRICTNEYQNARNADIREKLAALTALTAPRVEDLI